MKKINVTKKAVKVILNILMPLIVFLLGVLIATCLPEKQSTLVRKNSSWGENQMAIRKLPPVRCFLEYLNYVEEKDTAQMWNKSSQYRRSHIRNVNDLVYDYFLTNNYEVQYIIPIGEGNRLSEISSKTEHTFSFYALLRFEDDVCVEGEVDKLKNFRRTTVENICNSRAFDSLFKPVVEEVYDFVDRRFVIDSAEVVKKELRDYMMDMTIRDYVDKDWRFPIFFAKEHQLLPKQEGSNGMALYERLGHLILSEVVMLEEDGKWKLSRFRTIAMSRWEGDKELKK